MFLWGAGDGLMFVFGKVEEMVVSCFVEDFSGRLVVSDVGMAVLG